MKLAVGVGTSGPPGVLRLGVEVAGWPGPGPAFLAEFSRDLAKKILGELLATGDGEGVVAAGEGEGGGGVAVGGAAEMAERRRGRGTGRLPRAPAALRSWPPGGAAWRSGAGGRAASPAGVSWAEDSPG